MSTASVRLFVRSVICVALGSLLLAACARDQVVDPAIVDAPATRLREQLAAGQITAEQLTRAALARIAALDDAGPELNAIIEINPDAIELARELDGRFAAGGPTGALHGLPVALKANIDTADRMSTTAGSVALARHRAQVDAELVARLRDAGAVIIAKTNLSEWANFRGMRSSSGWSSLGGQTRNPYLLDHNPCGSSSGSAVAVAAGLVPLAIGTETWGSIVCPAAVNGVVGIKPTHGSVSGNGIIPVAASFDVAGPMARTVRGAALLLSALQGHADLGPAIDDREDLLGLRLGVWRDYAGAGTVPDLESGFADWLSILASAGAELIDPVELGDTESIAEAALDVMLFEFRAGIDAYLAAAETSPGSLGALIEYNEEHSAEVLPFFGQEFFYAAQQRGGLEDPDYAAALESSRTAMQALLQDVFTRLRIDALVVPAAGPAWKTNWQDGDPSSVSSSAAAALSGYPSVVVPAGLIDGLPVAIAFIGLPDAERSLLAIAQVFETARGEIPAPRFLSGRTD